ncbi:MAG: hypothetical protein JSS38_02945 [Nitrospira sp.]|nr:hypothetical protein [Nitrospira sp.]
MQHASMGGTDGAQYPSLLIRKIGKEKRRWSESVAAKEIPNSRIESPSLNRCNRDDQLRQ